MSTLYLVRHGQAGTRDDYDSLSPLGREQARLLGEYFRAQEIQFDHVYSGALKRQQATARAVLPGANFEIDEGWNEFDLAQVFAEHAPHLAASDAGFRRDYEAMQAALAESQGSPDHPVHRRWNDCDKKVIQAWIAGRFDYSGESWPVFVARIHGALERVAQNSGNTIVFTSATPIGISAASTLDIADHRAMQIAGVLLNASFTRLRIRPNERRLFSLNNTPHLTAATLHTFR
jgi:broad specificity phosphatase PhoE